MNSATNKLSSETRAARRALRLKGWTVTAAAEQFGVRREHLSLVLHGHRQSRRLLRLIDELPEHPDAA